MNNQQVEYVLPSAFTPPEELVVEQQLLCFQEDTLVTAYTNYMSFYVSVSSLCAAFRLTAKGQLQRMKQNPLLSGNLRQFTLKTRGGPQLLYCLNSEWIEYWLKGLHFKQVSVSLETKITHYQHDLPLALSSAFTGRRHLNDQPWLEQPFEKTAPSCIEYVEPFLNEDPFLEQKLAILASIPPPDLTAQLTSTDSQIDRSMREASFAREEQWGVDATMRIFSSSTNLQIYLGTPEAPLELAEAQTKIQQLGGSAALTARVVMGLWNLRRHDTHLSINGSAAVHVDEIFAWRGFRKHRRATYPGATRQRTDGYRTEQKQQVLRDLALLASCYVRGHCTVTVKGRRKTFYINGPYLRYSMVTTPTNRGGEEIVGFFLSPGDWITTYEAHDHDFLIDIDRRVFLLNPQNEQHELRLALYLVELWRQQAKQGLYDTSIMMTELLNASMIPIDRINLTRFATRIEEAMQTLWERGILGTPAECVTPTDKTKGHWGNDWLASQWVLVPSYKQQGQSVPLHTYRTR